VIGKGHHWALVVAVVVPEVVVAVVAVGSGVVDGDLQGTGGGLEEVVGSLGVVRKAHLRGVDQTDQAVRLVDLDLA
jgi:hypothetical protein